MIRWEYSITGFGRWTDPQLPEVLAECGEAGWELVAINWESRELIFKRPGGEA